MTFTQAACVAAMLILFGWLVSAEAELRRAEKWVLAVFAFLVACLMLGVWLWAVRNSQLAPHHIISSMNGRVLSEYWTTNPAYVTWADNGIPGFPLGKIHPVTNYYWQVWRIFQ